MQDAADKSKDRPSCPQCGNRLRVLPDQLGSTVRCPKCNATFVLGRSVKRAKSPPPPVAPEDAYEAETPLVRATIVPEKDRPSMLPDDAAPASEDDAYEPEIQLTPSRIVPDEETAGVDPRAGQQEYEVDWRTADDMEMEAPLERPPPPEELFLESARQRGLVRSYDEPDPPRWTFFSGVFGYPWRGVNLSRWTAMSFGLSISGMVALKTLAYLGLMDGQLTNMAIQGIMLAMFGIVIALASLSFAIASCQAAIQDTADGHDLPQEASLPDWDHWVFNFLGWFSLWAAAGALGFPLSLLIGPAAFLITSTLLFPVLLLSAMEADSFMMPYSPPVLRTLSSYFHGWLMFQLLTVAMAVGWVAAFDWGYARAPYLTVVFSGPVVAALMLIYARLLGRLAWRASGAPVVQVETDDKKQSPADAEPRPRKAKPAKRPKRSKIRIEIPDEVESRDEPPEAPPRINFHLRP